MHVEPALFARDYWGRTTLLSRAADLVAAGNVPGYADLLSADDADELLSRRGLRMPFLRIAHEGRVVPAADFTGGGGAGAEIGDQVLDEQVLARYADGATLVLQGLHRLWPPLIEFAGRLASELAAPVGVNAYLTPAGNRGFATHYDTHDVFVLQVGGRKRWRVHEPVLVDPLERQPWGGRANEVGTAAESPPVLDTVLEPGDSLYLPRGWLHAADALGEPSMHLTLGVRAANRYAVVEALLALAVGEPALRSGLPLGLDVTDPDQLAPELAATAGALRDWLADPDPDAVAAQLRRHEWQTTRPAPIRPLAQTDAIAGLDHETVLAPRGGLRWRITAPAAGRVSLQLPDRTLTVPSICEPAIRALLAGPDIRVGDMPGLDADDRLTLARRLLREAIAVPAGKP
ncbi:MAG TPA: cupin domain-containing protein [Jiangellaceae bacterium]|nr:cupin domain-containing protein [Jiangellaceae bacterium]